MNRDFSTIATELALKAVGHRFPRLSQLADGNRAHVGDKFDRSFRFPTPTVDGFSYFLLDITQTAEGRFHLIEANGSNAALSSSIVGRDDRRSRHMHMSYISRKTPQGQAVCLLTHQKALIHFAEFYLRAGNFARLLAEDQNVHLRDSSEELGDEEITVVVGAITDIAPMVTKEGDSLFYKGRPVGFASNPNLLAELVRLGTLSVQSRGYDIDDSIFHEGQCVPLVHDKGLQQMITENTNITPLRWSEGHDIDSCMRVIENFRADRIVTVGKMNAGSGGAGIQIFTPEMDMEQSRKTMISLVESAHSKHGSGVNRTLFPVRFFEFAQSTFYEVYGHPHLWDMRIQCLIQPGIVEVTPCVIRLCPKPFDGSYLWDTVVSNLSGRDPQLAHLFLRSPFANRRSQPITVLEGIGMTDDSLHILMEACAKWCAEAWNWATSKRVPLLENAVTMS